MVEFRLELDVLSAWCPPPPGPDASSEAAVMMACGGKRSDRPTAATVCGANGIPGRPMRASAPPGGGSVLLHRKRQRIFLKAFLKERHRKNSQSSDLFASSGYILVLHVSTAAEVVVRGYS